jgi:hypothetical protein
MGFRLTSNLGQIGLSIGRTLLIYYILNKLLVLATGLYGRIYTGIADG